MKQAWVDLAPAQSWHYTSGAGGRADGLGRHSV